MTGNYLAPVLALTKVLARRGPGLVLVNVEHDDGCGLLRRCGACDCAPVVTFKRYAASAGEKGGDA
jgi:hypothetical protein